jgi:diacylglycerol kinase family enzyme
VGGDGTAHEVLNGVLPEAEKGGPGGRVALGFQPLGTGNSFLRDFSDEGLEHATACLIEGRTRPCDVLRLAHADGVLYSINLVCLGFPADVAKVTNRFFKPLGPFGYVLGVLGCLARLPRRTFPMRADGAAAWERERCLFHTFSNSRYTGGRMMIAPQADTGDGLLEHVRMGPMGRLALLANLPRLFDGSYAAHRLAARRALRRVDFELDEPADVMIDGEVAERLSCRSLEVLPGAVEVYA